MPLNRPCREALEDWLKPRATMNDDLALFVGRGLLKVRGPPAEDHV